MRTTLIIVFLFFRTLLTAQVIDSIKVIRVEFSAGECVGYCHWEREYDSIEVMVSGSIIAGVNTNRSERDSSFIADAIDSAGTETITRPAAETIAVKSKLKKNKWMYLTNSIDLKRFYSFPPVMGCPDCTDGGAISVEITCTHSSHKVTFDYVSHGGEIGTFLQTIQIK